jgi:uncharacterized membrane protein
MLKKFLIAGCLIWLPIIATIWVIKFLVGIFDSLAAILPHAYQPNTLLGHHIPGLNVAVAITLVLLTGVLVTNMLGDRLVKWSDNLLKKVPFFGSIYSTVKQVLQTVISSEGKSFRKVLLVQYPLEGMWSIAFQTSEATAILNKAVDEELLCVFIPTTPNPTSGFLLMVPKAKVIELAMSVDEAFKFVISLGTLNYK